MLKRGSDFNRVYARGRRLAQRWLILYYLSNDLNITRAGFSVSRRHGKAVVRNLIKRRLKSAFEQVHEGVSGGYDLVWVPRIGLRDIDFRLLGQTMEQLLAQAGLSKD